MPVSWSKWAPAALSALVVAGIAASAGAQSYDFIRSKARQIVQRFESVVIERLHETAADGGVEGMMDVFTEEAYQTAEYLSGQTDWRVRWTSLDARSPANAPTDHERRVLKAFEELLEGSLDPHTMEFTGVVHNEESGKKELCYMQAIPVRRTCLNCHGQNIEPKIAEKLERRYPNDPATGYNIGEIRGAYSLCTPNYVLPLHIGP